MPLASERSGSAQERTPPGLRSGVKGDNQRKTIRSSAKLAGAASERNRLIATWLARSPPGYPHSADRRKTSQRRPGVLPRVCRWARKTNRLSEGSQFWEPWRIDGVARFGEYRPNREQKHGGRVERSREVWRASARLEPAIRSERIVRAGWLAEGEKPSSNILRSGGNSAASSCTVSGYGVSILSIVTVRRFPVIEASNGMTSSSPVGSRAFPTVETAGDFSAPPKPENVPLPFQSRGQTGSVLAFVFNKYFLQRVSEGENDREWIFFSCLAQR